MTVSPGSRQATLPVVEVTGPDGLPRRVSGLRLLRPEPEGRLVEHVVTSGETVDSLARLYLGDERLWPAILDANPLLHPFDIQPGQTLSIPLPAGPTRAGRARRF
ncbi:LysM peptidoglycan-binding domain-containing protein [Roseibium marinum]|uniref:LysM domain-containing protein n=1 Tax=Roseibium marinum TaxID=281252 RepID=A0A2S3UMZ2_9HYPH|nr:LysM domain-containing protein [Roseibium marinum]POF29087.1 LysM domain-containing protein [Roseibium marinum]